MGTQYSLLIPLLRAKIIYDIILLLMNLKKGTKRGYLHIKTCISIWPEKILYGKTRAEVMKITF